MGIRKIVFFISYIIIFIYILNKYDKPTLPSKYFLFELAALMGIIYVTLNYHYFEIKERSNKRIVGGIMAAIALLVLSPLAFMQQNNLVDQIVFVALALSLIIIAVQSILYLRKKRTESAN